MFDLIGICWVFLLVFLSRKIGGPDDGRMPGGTLR